MNRDFFKKGWETSGVDPNKLAKYARDPDKWDLEDYQNILRDIEAAGVAKDSLEAIAPTGGPAFADAFWVFQKVEPELLPPEEMRPDHMINHVVAQEMEALKETERLRRHTVGDVVASASAAVTIEPDLETLFDRLKTQRDHAEELHRKMQALHSAEEEVHDIEDMMQRWQDENPDNPEEGEGEGEASGMSQEPGQGTPGKSQGQRPGGPKNWQKEWKRLQQAHDAAEARAQQAQAEAEEAGQKFQESMSAGMSTVRTELREAVGKAADDAESLSFAADAWGLEPGVLQRMNAKERLDLAKRLNTPRFKKIADLLGAMRNLMLTEVSRKTIHTNEEVVNITLGNDLELVLSEQLADLRNPQTRLDFLRRFAEGELLQYEMSGTEKLAQGGIIYLEDGSGSMSGEREIWAKAVGLCLLHLARIQKRPFHGVHFGSPGQYKTFSFVNPEDFTIDRVLAFAEFFYGGGTDFKTPLSEGLRILQDEFRAKGAVEGDIVFATDGQCGVSEDFMETFKGEQERLDFAVWGISIGGHKMDEPLHSICDGRVATIKDLLSGADIRDVFRGVA